MLDRKRPVTAAFVAMTTAVINLESSLARGDHPNLSAEYVRDVERWCKHALTHLSIEAGKEIANGAPAWTLQP